MRILLLACAVLAVMPGIASADVKVIEVTEEEMQVILQDERVGREIYRVLDALELERFKDPEYRKSRVAGARHIYKRVLNVRGDPDYFPEAKRSEMRQQYEALQLSEAEYGQLLDLLAEFEVQGTAMHLETSRDSDLSAGITPEMQAAARDWLNRKGDIALKQEQAITAVLGPARYALWQQFLKNRKSWMSTLLPWTTEPYIEVLYRLRDIQEILSKARQSLSVEQVRPLAEALMAGVQRERLQAGWRDDQDPDSVISESFQTAAHKRVQENHKGTLEIAAAHLGEQQRAALMSGFEKQAAASQ